MITQIDTSKTTLNAQGQATTGRWYRLRILRAAPGATIAWGSVKDAIGAFPGAIYENRRGLVGIWISGVMVIEYTDDPAEQLSAVQAAGQQLDGGNNAIVVGPTAPGAAPAAGVNPVQVAGSDGVNVRTLNVSSNGSLSVLLNGNAVAAAEGGTGGGSAVVRAGGVDAAGNMRTLGAAVTGAAVPPNTLQVGGSDGVNLRALRTDPQGSLAAGNSQRPRYTIPLAGQAPTTGTWDLFVIEAGTTLITRLRRLRVFQCGSQTAAGLHRIQVIRTTTAGAGSVVTPAAVDSADAAFSGICRGNGPGAGSAGTLGTVVFEFDLWIPAALGPFTPFEIDFTCGGVEKGIKIPAGVANGLTIRDITGGAGAANVQLLPEFTEESA